MNANIATIFPLPTLETVAQNYRNYITSQNPSINPNIPNTDFYLKSFGISGICTGIVGDASYYFINIFPQYKTGTFLDIGLQAAGLPPRFSATYATAILGTGSPPAASFTVQAGMQLNEPITNTIFQILTTTLINGTNYNNIPSVCTIIGSGNQLTSGTVLYFATPPIDADSNPVLSLTVQPNGSVSGTDAETDDQANQRLLATAQIPQSGSRITDYFYYALDANIYSVPEPITWAITVPNNQFQSTNGYNFGVFGLTGAGITDAILDQGIINDSTNYELFNRSISSGTISAIETSIGIQQLINITPYVDSIGTQFLPTVGFGISMPFIQVQVVLQIGFILSSILTINTTDPQNPTIKITVEQLIQREVRRAICQQPYGASQTLSDSGSIDSSTIYTSAIEQQLDYALGTAQYQGIYATILVDRIIEIWNQTASQYQPINIALNIGIPNPPPATTGGGYPLLWIYDISSATSVGYGNISVIT